LLSALFRSFFFFPFQRISFLFAKFKHLIIIIIIVRRQQQQHNTHHSDPKVVDKNDKKKDFAKFKEEDNTAHSNSKGTYIHTYIQTLNHILF
jgi:hypothetical protein